MRHSECALAFDKIVNHCHCAEGQIRRRKVCVSQLHVKGHSAWTEMGKHMWRPT